MERTFDFKSEYIEEVKAECKKEKLSRDELKQRTGDAEKKVKEIRRNGTKALKQMFAEICEDEEIDLRQKVSYFTEQAHVIRAKMDELLTIGDSK